MADGAHAPEENHGTARGYNSMVERSLSAITGNMETNVEATGKIKLNADNHCPTHSNLKRIAPTACNKAKMDTVLQASKKTYCHCRPLCRAQRLTGYRVHHRAQYAKSFTSLCSRIYKCNVYLPRIDIRSIYVRFIHTPYT